MDRNSVVRTEVNRTWGKHVSGSAGFPLLSDRWERKVMWRIFVVFEAFLRFRRRVRRDIAALGFPSMRRTQVRYATTGRRTCRPIYRSEHTPQNGAITNKYTGETFYQLRARTRSYTFYLPFTFSRLDESFRVHPTTTTTRRLRCVLYIIYSGPTNTRGRRQGPLRISRCFRHLCTVERAFKCQIVSVRPCVVYRYAPVMSGSLPEDD